MDILKGTMAKRINGVETHFYPQTSGDMVSIGDTDVATSIKELRSRKGICVSDTEPTDENVAIWIDTSLNDCDMAPEIKDEEVSSIDTWSSKQIVNFVEEALGVVINGVY